MPALPRIPGPALRPFSSLAASALLLLASCGGESSEGTPGGGGGNEPRVLRVSQGSDVISMDPYFKLESPTFNVLINIHDPLTDISPEMKIVPALAESWTHVEPLVWEFKLRAGVKFHNGNAFDAADAAHSLKRARDWPQSRLRSEIPTLKEAAAGADPLTLRIETTVPDAILPTRLASVMIMDKETCEKGIAEGGDEYLRTNANGTGPYKLKEWVKDAHCLLEADENHWRGAPEVKQIKFLAMSGDSTRVAAFLDGQVDIMCNVPVRDVDRVKAQPGFSVVSRPSLRLIYLGLDTGRDKTPGVPSSPPNPLKDVRVRRAIYLAINEDLIVERIMNGHAAPASQLFPEPITGYNPDIKRPAHDPEKAKALLAEAGFPNGFEVRLDAPNDRYVNDAAIAEAVAGQLAKVGIKVTVNAMPKSRFFAEEEKGNCSMTLIGWANTNGDGNGTFDHLLHTMDATKNLGDANTTCNYSNPEVDRLTEAAASEFDPAKRKAMLQEAVRLTMEDLPHIPLHYQMDIYAVSNKVEWRQRYDTQVRGVDVKWR